MKLVFDARIHLPHITGISKYILHVLEELALLHKDWDIKVLLNGGIPKEDIAFELISRHANLQEIIVDKAHFGPVNYYAMPRIIRSLKPDVYHYPHLDAPISGVPTVATIHDANLKNGIKKFHDPTGLKSFYFKQSIKNTLKKADAVVFISNAVKHEILQQQNRPDCNRFHVIYNGFPSNYAQFDTVIEQATIKKYHLPDKYFLFVGQMREHKNIFRVLQAHRESNTEIPLYLVGYNYSQLTFDQPGVHYLGMVSDDELKVIYKKALCFLFPSLIEGFGFPILESFSFGVPVITSKGGATEEVAGGKALLVDPYSVKDIKNKLLEVMHASVIDKEGLKKRASQFSWTTNAQQLTSIYQSIL